MGGFNGIYTGQFVGPWMKLGYRDFPPKPTPKEERNLLQFSLRPKQGPRESAVIWSFHLGKTLKLCGVNVGSPTLDFVKTEGTRQTNLPAHAYTHTHIKDR